ncbi:MAG TPA: M28 family peptidase [Gemmatimonadaceae bacterium]|nr:M28 family peptidase [Gemmatimonadaceae bacterium]
MDHTSCSPRVTSRGFVALAALLAGCATAGTTVASPSGEMRTHTPTPTVGAISAADAMTRLYIFADDSMLGREAGTLGNVKGTNYVAAEMKRMGLEPGGENGTYFQTVPIVISTLDTAHTIRVGGSPLALRTDVLPIDASTAGRAVPVGARTRSVDGAQVVYGGQLGGQLISPEAAAGKLVIFTVPPATTGRRDYRFFFAGPMAQYAAAAGLAGVTLDAVPPSSIGRLTGPQTHPRSEPTLAEGPAVMIISPSAAERLLGVSSLQGLRVGATGGTVSGNVGFIDTPSRYPARNVIGILRGSDPLLRGEFVAIGAHNDHIGLTPRPLDHDSVLANNMVVRRQGVQDPVRAPTAAEAQRIRFLRDSLTRAHSGARPDSVNNGADDDGSGTVAMLEIAERFATAPSRPRRSLIFVSHTGEEKGLWGSQWFTDHPTVPRDSIVAQLNMDMVGRGKPTDIMGRGPNNVQLIGPRRLSTQLGDLIDSLNAVRTPHMDIDTSFDANGHPLNRYCRSDHYMYARYGIPITYFSLGYHTDYHQVTDEPQYIDYGHLARIAQFVHDIAEAVANRPQRLVVDKPIPDPNGGCRQ